MPLRCRRACPPPLSPPIPRSISLPGPVARAAGDYEADLRAVGLTPASSSAPSSSSGDPLASNLNDLYAAPSAEAVLGSGPPLAQPFTAANPFVDANPFGPPSPLAAAERTGVPPPAYPAVAPPAGPRVAGAGAAGAGSGDDFPLDQWNKVEDMRELTSASEKQCKALLRANGFDLERSLEAFFTGQA